LISLPGQKIPFSDSENNSFSSEVSDGNYLGIRDEKDMAEETAGPGIFCQK
jgi:hypothetical protein